MSKGAQWHDPMRRSEWESVNSNPSGWHDLSKVDHLRFAATEASVACGINFQIAELGPDRWLLKMRLKQAGRNPVRRWREHRAYRLKVWAIRTDEPVPGFFCPFPMTHKAADTALMGISQGALIRGGQPMTRDSDWDTPTRRIVNYCSESLGHEHDTKRAPLYEAHQEAMHLYATFFRNAAMARGEYAYFHLAGDDVRRDELADAIDHLEKVVMPEALAKAERLYAELQRFDELRS